MDGIKDIRIEKNNIRQQYMSLRQKMQRFEKRDADLKILKRILVSHHYKKAKTLLCFVSTKDEVDTHALIKQAFIDGKTVAVPKCINKKGSMHFFVINSFDDLKKSNFGILEPDKETSKRLLDFTDSICILPGFVFDKYGIRIGYGKGYYDRFLSKYQGKKIGVCYDNCMTDLLPRGKYDVAADMVVTQIGIIRPIKIEVKELDDERR